MCGVARLPTVKSPGPHRAAGNKEPDMTQVNGNGTNQAETRYETPTFDPGSAFSWTLRAGEMARLEARRTASRGGEPVSFGASSER
jgi:hypothetical protein